MSARSSSQPIPLRPDRDAMSRSERRSLIRACVALALGAKQGVHPRDVVKVWNDDRAEMILRAASNPATTTGNAALGLQTTRVLPMLAPASASARVLAMANALDLSGLQSIRLPFIGLAGRPPVPFVLEGDPGSVVDLTVSATVLGPTKKLLILSALTREMSDASAGNAEVIIGDALALSAEQSLDAALFSNAAATPSAPAGLLFGLTPITAATGGGAMALAADLAALAGAIGGAGINPDDMVIITTPALATKVRVLASPKFTNTVFSSSSLAAGVVIAIVPRGLATGYDGGVTVEASREAVVNFESTTPLPIVDGAGVVAKPVYSAFQSDMTILKIRGNVAWAVQPGAIAEVTGAAW
jgi:hypothetical protein